MSKELIDRLRDAVKYELPDEVEGRLFGEVADLIETQAAQIALLREALRLCSGWVEAYGQLETRETVKTALAATPDDAIAAVTERVKERCAHEGWMAASSDCEDRVRAAIRNLRVTL
jgi:hypothetical protein